MKVDKIINEYKKSRIITKREMWPRKLQLHDVVKSNLKKQIKLLQKSGKSDKAIIGELQKSIPFLVDEVNEESTD